MVLELPGGSRSGIRPAMEIALIVLVAVGVVLWTVRAFLVGKLGRGGQIIPGGDVDGPYNNWSDGSAGDSGGGDSGGGDGGGSD